MKWSVKKILKRALIVLILAILVAVIGIAVTTPLPGFIYGWRTAWTDSPEYVTVLCIYGVIILVLLVMIVIGPFLLFVLRRLCTYLSLACLCWRKKTRFRMLRVPFASLKRQSSKGDISITRDEGRIRIHFVDVIFARRGVVTFPNAESYVITPVTKGPPSRWGGGGGRGPRMNGGRTAVIRSTGYTLLEDHDLVKPLPEVSGEPNVQHILVVQSTPAEICVIRDGSRTPVAVGEELGPFRIWSVKQLKKGLKGELYTSLFDNQS